MVKQKSRGRTAGHLRFAKAGIPPKDKEDDTPPIPMGSITGAFDESRGDLGIRGPGVDNSDIDSSDPRSFDYNFLNRGRYTR